MRLKIAAGKIEKQQAVVEIIDGVFEHLQSLLENVSSLALILIVVKDFLHAGLMVFLKTRRVKETQLFGNVGDKRSRL